MEGDRICTANSLSDCRDIDSRGGFYLVQSRFGQLVRCSVLDSDGNRQLDSNVELGRGSGKGSERSTEIQEETQ